MGAPNGETTSVQILEDGIPILTIDRPTDINCTKGITVRERRVLGTYKIAHESDFNGTTLTVSVPTITPEIDDFVARIQAKAVRRVRPNITAEWTIFYPETGATRTNVLSNCHMGDAGQAITRGADNTFNLNFMSGEEAVYG